MEEGRRNSPKKKVSDMAGTSSSMRRSRLVALMTISLLGAREMTCGRKDEGEWFMGAGERHGVVDEAHL
jgi:hypothetical protein